jgi:hypothetical protein
MRMNGNRIARFIDCVCQLGLRKGLEYWKLQNSAIKNPNLVLDWAHGATRLAKKMRKAGLINKAEAYEKWANNLKKTHRQHLENLKNKKP